MFSLIRGFWDYIFTRPSLHILVVGLDHAGLYYLYNAIVIFILIIIN